MAGRSSTRSGPRKAQNITIVQLMCLPSTHAKRLYPGRSVPLPSGCLRLGRVRERGDGVERFRCRVDGAVVVNQHARAPYEETLTFGNAEVVDRLDPIRFDRLHT